MRLAIRYVTRFLYAGPVWQSHNALRARPLDDDRQRVIEYRVTTTPPSRVFSYVDYWGTHVDTFGVRPPHPRLEVVAEVVVESQPPSLPAWASGSAADATGVSGTALAAPEFVGAHLEYLEPSPHVRWDRELSARAEEWIAPADDAVGAVLALYRAVGATLRYAPGATTVGVDVNAVLRERVGVCQDFAHLFIALCRSVGVPARYVSGYLLANDAGRGEDEPPGGVIEVKTHAWTEVALPGLGWVPLDPTNQRPVGARHVKIGHGRDYDDVLPLRGVYYGGPEHQLDVVVRMRELQTSQQQ